MSDAVQKKHVIYRLSHATANSDIKTKWLVVLHYIVARSSPQPFNKPFFKRLAGRSA